MPRARRAPPRRPGPALAGDVPRDVWGGLPRSVEVVFDALAAPEDAKLPDHQRGRFRCEFGAGAARLIARLFAATDPLERPRIGRVITLRGSGNRLFGFRYRAFFTEEQWAQLRQQLSPLGEVELVGAPGSGGAPMQAHVWCAKGGDAGRVPPRYRLRLGGLPAGMGGLPLPRLARALAGTGLEVMEVQRVVTNGLPSADSVVVVAGCAQRLRGSGPLVLAGVPGHGRPVKARYTVLAMPTLPPFRAVLPSLARCHRSGRCALSCS